MPTLWYMSSILSFNHGIREWRGEHPLLVCFWVLDCYACYIDSNTLLDTRHHIKIHLPNPCGYHILVCLTDDLETLLLSNQLKNLYLTTTKLWVGPISNIVHQIYNWKDLPVRELILWRYVLTRILCSKGYFNVSVLFFMIAVTTTTRRIINEIISIHRVNKLRIKLLFNSWKLREPM